MGTRGLWSCLGMATGTLRRECWLLVGLVSVREDQGLTRPCPPEQRVTGLGSLHCLHWKKVKKEEEKKVVKDFLWLHLEQEQCRKDPERQLRCPGEWGGVKAKAKERADRRLGNPAHH